MTQCILILLAVVSTAWAYSAGAPESVCDDMTPKHPVLPQKTPLPYKITVSQKEVKPGQEIDIGIGGDKVFKGLLVQVRNGDKAVGSFDISGDDKYFKTINCHNTKGSAATHKNAAEKKNIILKWKAPSATGNYKVFVTVAADGGTFWARHEVQPIKVN